MSHLTDPAVDEDGPSGEADQIISRQRSPLSHLADPIALGGGSYDVEDIDIVYGLLGDGVVLEVMSFEGGVP